MSQHSCYGTNRMTRCPLGKRSSEMHRRDDVGTEPTQIDGRNILDRRLREPVVRKEELDLDVVLFANSETNTFPAEPAFTRRRTS